MTDAHFHRGGYAAFLACGKDEWRFVGVHPWEAAALDETEVEARLADVEAALRMDSACGVGEIGLDRLKSRTIPELARRVFGRQLELAAAYRRPVVLHGAKCWGEVVRACRPHAGRVPAFLFHGFSRSGGLVPEIRALNGYVGVGLALLNDRAVNYRALVAALPPDRVVPESDMEDGPERVRAAAALAAALATRLGVDEDAFARNARAFAAGEISKREKERDGTT